MSLANEFEVLMRSDMAAGGLDQITTRFQVWASNTLVHASAGFAGYFAGTYFPEAARWLWYALAAYMVLQVVHLFTGRPFTLLLFDSLFDVLAVLAGLFAAQALSMRGVQS